jgi:hypothetical protein
MLSQLDLHVQCLIWDATMNRQFVYISTWCLTAAIVGRNNDKIVSMDDVAGRCILYDMAAHAIHSLPSLQKSENKFGY